MENSENTEQPVVETESSSSSDERETKISLTISGGNNSAATAGGVIGIVGAVLSLIPVAGIFIGIPAGILAVIFSSIGMARAKAQSGSSGMGMAVAGLVLGILTIIFKLIPGVNLI